VPDHKLDARGAFAPSLLELVVLLEELAINQRGPGILGYFTQLELNFEMRADASYAPHSRVVSLSLGFPLLANELEATYRWLESVFFRESGMIPLGDLARMKAPLEVRDELEAFYRAGAEGLPISGKSGVEHPIGQALLRFVLAHELGHMIDFAESPQLRASWRETVWSHYQDALDYCLSTGAIDRSRYTRFLRSSLDTQVADQWATEFLADGLGFYTLSKLPPPSGMTWERSYAVLQSAVGMFFHVLVLQVPPGSRYRHSPSPDSP